MVYKVCEFKGIPRIKLSEEPEKTTVAGSKSVIRAVNAAGEPVFDILCMATEYESLLKDMSNLKVFDRLSKVAIDLTTLNIASLEGLSMNLFEIL